MPNSPFTRIAQRTATYAEWKAQNDNTPGGLKLMEGEVCVIIADQASASDGLSNTVAQPGPLRNRLANTGEVLGTKVGNGANVRWDETPTNYHVPVVNFPNGTGRVLGTRENGASHVYDHPGKMFQALFAPVYAAPEVGAGITSAGSNINGSLLEVGQALPAVLVQANPNMRSYPIKRGRIFEETNGRAQLGADQTAISPNTITAFNREAVAFNIIPDNSSRRSDGVFVRRFFADVTDSRPSAEGGELTRESGRVEVYAAYPTFFGKTTLALPGSEAGRGSFVVDNCSRMIRGRSNYNAGKLTYSGGERPVFAYPESYGPLSLVLDELGLNQLGYNGAAIKDPVRALVSKAGQYQDVPYLVYEAGAGFNGDILFNFLF